VGCAVSSKTQQSVPVVNGVALFQGDVSAGTFELYLSLDAQGGCVELLSQDLSCL
jgi:hypothetical protein